MSLLVGRRIRRACRNTAGCIGDLSTVTLSLGTVGAPSFAATGRARKGVAAAAVSGWIRRCTVRGLPASRGGALGLMAIGPRACVEDREGWPICTAGRCVVVELAMHRVALAFVGEAGSRAACLAEGWRLDGRGARERPGRAPSDSGRVGPNSIRHAMPAFGGGVGTGPIGPRLPASKRGGTNRCFRGRARDGQG